jgi:hypothetical protein
LKARAEAYFTKPSASLCARLQFGIGLAAFN